MKESQMRKKSQKWWGSQNRNESSRMRDSQTMGDNLHMRDNQQMRGSKKSRASPKLREIHSGRASGNPRQSQRASLTLPQSALLKITCPGRQKEKRTERQRIPPQTEDSPGCGSRGDDLFICTFPTKEHRLLFVIK